MLRLQRIDRPWHIALLRSGSAACLSLSPHLRAGRRPAARNEVRGWQGSPGPGVGGERRRSLVL